MENNNKCKNMTDQELAELTELKWSCICSRCKHKGTGSCRYQYGNDNGGVEVCIKGTLEF